MTALERRQALLRGSAARRSWGPSWRLESGIAEESEDPWGCGPGFGRVCLCRELRLCDWIYKAEPGLSSSAKVAISRKEDRLDEEGRPSGAPCE